MVVDDNKVMAQKMQSKATMLDLENAAETMVWGALVKGGKLMTAITVQDAKIVTYKLEVKEVIEEEKIGDVLIKDLPEEDVISFCIDRAKRLAELLKDPEGILKDIDLAYPHMMPIACKVGCRYREEENPFAW